MHGASSVAAPARETLPDQPQRRLPRRGWREAQAHGIVHVGLSAERAREISGERIGQHLRVRRARQPYGPGLGTAAAVDGDARRLERRGWNKVVLICASAGEGHGCRRGDGGADLTEQIAAGLHTSMVRYLGGKCCTPGPTTPCSNASGNASAKRAQLSRTPLATRKMRKYPRHERGRSSGAG